MKSEKQKPEKTLSDGAIKATIWKREGPKGNFYSTGFAKTYRDDQGNYQNSQSFSGTDLLKISVLAKQAYQESRELYFKDRQAEQAPKSPDHNYDREQ